MIQYTVGVKQIHSANYIIESETPLSREELLKKGMEQINGVAGCDIEEEDSFTYDRTLDSSEWSTCNAETEEKIT